MKKAPKTLLNADLTNKTVLVRVDYNVPTKDGVILDDFKIRSTIPTIQYLLNHKCKVILLSHIGDPKGSYNDSLSLMDVRFALGRILEKQIKFANISACENSIKFMDFGEVLMLENLKFSPLETSKKDSDKDEYVKTLLKLGDAYVFEAYGVDINVASISSLAKKIPTYIGFHFEEEVKNALYISQKNNESVTAILGNEDITNSLELISVLVKGKNNLLIGGELALYFLNSMNVDTGSTELDSKILSKISKYIKSANKNGCNLHLPVDYICLDKKNNKLIELNTQSVPKDLYVKDIGSKTLTAYREIIESSSVVLWHGVMGEFNIEQFNKGTEAIGEYIALSTPKDAYKLAIGSNVSIAMTLLKIKQKRFSFISSSPDLIVDFMQNKESDILTLLS